MASTAETVITVRLTEAEAILSALMTDLAPDDVALPAAAGVYAGFAKLERLAKAGCTLMARRVAESEAWRRSGFPSPAEWLAHQKQTSLGEAKREAETSDRLKALPDTEAALKDGDLSSDQAEAIADAAAVNPAAERDLLGEAAKKDLSDLRRRARSKKAAGDPDPDATQRRLHRERRCRSWMDGEGAWNLAARGPLAGGIQVQQLLDQLTDEIAKQARATGSREGREAFTFDALVELARRHGTGNGSATDAGSEDEPAATSSKSSKVNPKHLALLRIDLEALVRGRVEGDELCEITGLGPIPIRLARQLLGESILHLVITRGKDVATTVHLGRGPNAAQKVALLWSQPFCSNSACGRTHQESDHREPYADVRETWLGNIDGLCGHDHDLKTYKGWSLVGGTGRRDFVAPDDPRHPKNTGPPGDVEPEPGRIDPALRPDRSRPGGTDLPGDDPPDTLFDCA